MKLDVDLLSDYVAHFAKEIFLRMNRWFFYGFELTERSDSQLSPLVRLGTFQRWLHSEIGAPVDRPSPDVVLLLLQRSTVAEDLSRNIASSHARLREFE